MDGKKKAGTGPSLLSQWKQKKSQLEQTGLKSRPADEPALASSGQQRLWLLQKLYPENTFYQYAHLFKIKGQINAEILEQSFKFIIGRHEILRSNYSEQGLDLMLKISPQDRFELKKFDLSNIDIAERSEKAEQIISENAMIPFDLANDALFRVSLIKITEHEYRLLLSMHHIIGDRASLEILKAELFQHYADQLNGSETAIDPLKFQYTDFAYWQRKKKIKPAAFEYWKKQLDRELPFLALPSDFPRPKISSFAGATRRKSMSPALSQQLQALAKKHKTTPYVLFLAAFKVLLHRYTNHTDIIVGSPFSNRDQLELEKLIGFFNETIVLRTQLNSDLPFSDIINLVKETSQQAFAHKDVPFDELVKTIQPERHGSSNPFFQAMFLFNSIHKAPPVQLEWEIEEEMLDLGVSKFDLTLFVNEHAENISCSFEYSKDLFSETTIDRLLQQFEILLTAIGQDTALPIAQLPLLPTSERQVILEEWNKTQVDFPVRDSIHSLIEEMAVRYPQQIAVVDEIRQITYLDLNAQANAVAHTLISAGAKANAPIGLFVGRRVEMAIGILGILKAGAAYLPLDPAYPQERIDFITQDAKATIILSEKRWLDKINVAEKLAFTFEDAIHKSIPSNWTRPKGNPRDLAYIIYTSGSTGTPKGVPIQHQQLLHATQARFSFYPSTPSAFLLLSSFSFDSSIAGIFWTLCSGGKLVIPPLRIEQDVQRMSQLIATEQVSHTLLLPTLYATIINLSPLENLTSLKNVMVAGEACPFSLIDQHYQNLPSCQLYNEYGPTEATVWCIAHLIEPTEQYFVPIGKAIPNAQVYILDKHFQPQPIGVPGEVYIGGKGISTGYLHRLELSKEKFLPNPFHGEGKQNMYRTGDLARFHADGKIEFLGRADQQIKIRGFRVELEEIQQVFLLQKKVTEAIVLVHKMEDQQRLVAYINELEEAEIENVRVSLRGRLPDYMVPSLIIGLPEFPRLPNGKINRKALPTPTANSFHKKSNYQAPQNETEQLLAEIWEAVLKINPIGRQENFFSIGGDSILSIQIVAAAQDLGIRLAPNQLFEHQTIAELAEHVVLEKPSMTTLEIENPDRFELSHLQKAFYFNSQSQAIDEGQLFLVFHLSGPLQFQRLQAAWQNTALKHDVLRTYVSEDGQTGAIQVIAEHVNFDWTQEDWRQKNDIQVKQELEILEALEKKKPLHLTKTPTSRLKLIQVAEAKYLLCWSCHHLFLDGWSCGIILKDALEFYSKKNESNKTGEAKPKVTPNYLAFLQWQKNQDQSKTINFWKNNLAGFIKPLLFSRSAQTALSSTYTDRIAVLSQTESKQLRTFCQKNNIALVTLLQGIWSIVLGQFFATDDVTYGLTVSGRFAPFPGITSTAGLFMNVIPNRCNLNNQHNLITWLQHLQKEQGKTGQHEQASLDQISDWNNWPKNVALFDALFVFGNFLKEGVQTDDLSIDNFTGGFTSSYPLTIRINPLDKIEWQWRYDELLVTSPQIDWLADAFQKICKYLSDQNDAWLATADLESIKAHIPQTVSQPRLATISQLQKPQSTKKRTEDKYAAPSNELENNLTKIWEKLFNIHPIGVEDNFFELGGKSMMALQLFAAIESELDITGSPALLFKNPTISGLARALTDDQTLEEESSLVPLRSTGSLAPLFCLHGGGAHVFFYQEFAEELSDDLPVYSLQPRGLDGQEAFHQSIEEMAADYIQVIQKVQPSGPYQILGTCFSNAVALEIGRQLKAKQEEVALLAIIDSGPMHLIGRDQEGGGMTVLRFWEMLKRGETKRIKQKITGRFFSNKKTTPKNNTPETQAARNLRLTIDSLNTLYANYSWSPFSGKIDFIRSTEFAQRPDKKYHLSQWQKISSWWSRRSCNRRSPYIAI